MAHRTLRLIEADDHGEGTDSLALSLSDTAIEHHASEPFDNPHDWRIERTGSSITVESRAMALEWRFSLQLARHGEGDGEAGRAVVSLEASSWYDPASSITEANLEMAHLKTSVHPSGPKGEEYRDVVEALERLAGRLRRETRKALADVASGMLECRFAM